MCEKAILKDSDTLQFVPERYVTQEMCERVIKKEPWLLELVPDQHITQETCERAAKRSPWLLEFVPEWFTTPRIIYDLDNGEDFDNNVDLVKWSNDYKQPKAWKNTDKR